MVKKNFLLLRFFFNRKFIFLRLKDGKPLTPDLGFESQFDVKTGQITLKHKGATPKHAGELICRVENSAGTTDAPVKLDVQSNIQITTKKNSNFHC